MKEVGFLGIKGSLLLISVIALNGCSQQTLFQERHIVVSQQDIQIEEQLSTEIRIVDPTTKNLIMSYMPDHYKLTTSLVDYKQELEGWVKDLANGLLGHETYNQDLKLDKVSLTGEIIKGHPLIRIKEEELVEHMMALSFIGGEIELPLDVVESNYKKEDIPTLNEVVLGSYTTYFNRQKSGRSKNIELSAKALHNVIVGSGDNFSFNMSVGPRNIESGYQRAPEIVRGKTIMGIGGGICQTSSTLFNAVDKVGVEIIERHHHSSEIGYVPKGRDATVTYGGLDFQFQNTIGVPFLIKTYYGHGSLTILVTTSKEYEDLLDSLED